MAAPHAPLRDRPEGRPPPIGRVIPSVRHSAWSAQPRQEGLGLRSIGTTERLVLPRLLESAGSLPYIARVSEPFDVVAVVERGMQLYAAGKLVELRKLVHEDAEIQMAYLHGEFASGPDALEKALRNAAQSVHRPRMDGIEAIDDNAAILFGRVRYPLDGGGFGDRQAAWLNVLKDGLMWRVRIYSDVEAARKAYAEDFLPELLT